MEKPPAYGPEPGFAPPYQPPPHPMMMPQSTAHYQPQVVMDVPVQFGDRPIPIQCPYCHQHVVTETTYAAGGLTYLIAFGIALFFWCGCCFIPCCMDSCKDVYHGCPNCKTQLGIYKRL